MLPSEESFKKIYETLEKSFKRPNARNVRMVGLLFARPNAPLVSTQKIIQNRDYFHIRSGENVDFYWIGYIRIKSSKKIPNKIITPEIGMMVSQLNMDGTVRSLKGITTHNEETWQFSDEIFDDFRKEMEHMTKWKYSGGTELILINAKYNSKKDKCDFDFSSPIVCLLDQMIADGAILSVGTFFEDIFRFMDEFSDSNPTGGFSDKMGLKVAKSGIKGFILSFIPKGVGKDYTRANHFAIRDIGKDN